MFLRSRDNITINCATLVTIDSIDIRFIHGDIHGRSCKKILQMNN